MTAKSRTILASCLIGIVSTVAGGLLYAQEQTIQPSGNDELAGEQQRIADKYKRLEETLLRMAELTSATDPSRSALLKHTVSQSKEKLVGVQFEQLAEKLERGKLSEALNNSGQLSKDLRAILALLLSENRVRRIEAKKAKIRKYLKRLGRIIREQKGIQGRTSGKTEMPLLADDQARLNKKTGILVKDIRRNEDENLGPLSNKKLQSVKSAKGLQNGEKSEQKKAPREGRSQSNKSELRQTEPRQQKQQNLTHQRLQAAKARMRGAEEKLRNAQRKGAIEDQEKAIEELEEAKGELEEILRQLREEEIQRTLTALETRLKKMLHMQMVVYKGTLWLDKVPENGRGRSHEIEASQLSRKENIIIVEAQKTLTLLREDGSAAAITEAVEQIKEDMLEVSKRLGRVETGKITIEIQGEIISALEEVIETVQKAINDHEKRLTKKQSSRNTQPSDPPLVNMLAEIKMIRALQMRVNRRTKLFSSLVKGEQTNNAELLQSLKQLAKREQRIYRITRDLDSGDDR